MINFIKTDHDSTKDLLMIKLQTLKNKRGQFAIIENIWVETQYFKVSCHNPEFDYFIIFDILQMSYKLSYFFVNKKLFKH